jgi:demethylphylloquinol methyltransferase
MLKSVSTRSRNYDRVAWFYEQASRIYSTNQIRKSKAAQMEWLKPGDKILYLGVGAGEDAIMAARRGAKVTCIDLSSGMLDRLRDKLQQEGLTAELLCMDAHEHDRIGQYDAVATNYFLNCFTEEPMQKMMQLAATFVRPGGRFMIADVALPQGNLASRVFNLLYLKMAMAIFWTQGLVPWHRNYDYVAYLPTAGLKLERVDYFRFLKRGPVLFQNIVATKQVTQSLSMGS